MEERLGHMASTPTLVLMSGSDEYVPSSVDHQALAARFAKHLGVRAPQSLQVRAPSLPPLSAVLVWVHTAPSRDTSL